MIYILRARCAEGYFKVFHQQRKRRKIGVPQHLSCDFREVDDDNVMPQFERYIGIDYSGAKTPTESLRGLRVYAADWVMPPREILPPPSPRKYWTRRGLAEWLVAQLSGDKPTLVGIDHGFSFPLPYFEKHRLAQTGRSFSTISKSTGRQTEILM